jgi:Ca2+-binding RTX toxin-like protein
VTASGVGVSNAAPVGAGFNLDAGDLRFILKQIKISQAHSAGGELFGPDPLTQVPERRLPFGLRTVDGTFNNLLPASINNGAADQVFPRLTEPFFRDAEDVPPGFGPPGSSSYTQLSGNVFDSQPRTISNLIVDQTDANPAAVAAASFPCATTAPTTCPIPNVAPDVGLSAPFNPLFTFFGQFFDHGLDLVTKGGGTVFMPLKTDDPLFDAGPDGDPTTVADNGPNFMVITRATNLPGPNGILGDSDDIQEATNTTTSFVDQNQTYTSHPSHQVFLREYDDTTGVPVSTGKMIDGVGGAIGNWFEVKTQAAQMLGIQLVDTDVFNIPLLATDPYGYFTRSLTGFPQIITVGPDLVGVDNPATVGDESADNGVRVGDPLAPITTEGPNVDLAVDADDAVKTGHAFLDDIAHHAVPNNSKTPDADPGTTDDGDGATYDDELLNAHFITGDGRGNENVALTAVHTVFHSEHNRLADRGGCPTLINCSIDFQIHALLSPGEILDWETPDAASGWDYGEKLFQAAKFATEMQYQHLVFEEFARKMVPNINPFIGDGISFVSEVNPAIPAEFAHAAFRLGHSMLTDQVTRTDADGIDLGSLSLVDAFLNPVAFNNGGALTAAQAAGRIVQGMARDAANEIDEFVIDAVRNELLGLPLDLPAINMARGRSEGIPPFNDVRRQLFDLTGRPELAPYDSWTDFGFSLKHQETLVNFVAAYGTGITGNMAAKRAAADAIVNGTTDPGPDLTLLDDPSTVCVLPNDPVGCDESADNFSVPPDSAFMNSGATGLETVDLWVGGLSERQAPFGSLLGSTFSYIFENTLENLQDSDRFYYLERLNGLNLLVQLEGNSFAELIERNTTAEGLPADVFSRPDLVFHLNRAAFTTNAPNGPILDDPLTLEYDESTLLVRMPNGTIRFNGGEHVIWLGRDDAGDLIRSSEGDDTLRGHGDSDIMEGGDGNDQFLGGDGDDILTDIFGTDVLKGGAGNDVLSSGPGPDDLNQGGLGNDFIVAGSEVTETFGGPGDDIIFAGGGENEALGDTGDDWIQGGQMLDLLIGDNDNQFQDDPSGGHDVINGGLGDDDYDAEGGDDVMINDSFGTERNEGMLGFDWTTYRGDPLPVDADMNINVVVAPNLDELRDRFDLVEGLSGFDLDDILRGDSRLAVNMVGHELNQAGIARISGLSELLCFGSPTLPGCPLAATSFTGGNIILGGEGSDLIEGRAGDDRIDGDKWLNAQLRAPDPATADPFDTKLVDNMTQLRADVLAGRINPGDIDIVRSIVTPLVGAPDCGTLTPTNCDTALFSDAFANYVITPNADGSVTVDHVGGTAIDGRDTLTNIENLRFCLTSDPVTGTCLTFENHLVTEFAPAVEVTPAGPLAFGDVIIGAVSTVQTITVKNIGVTVLNVGPVTLGGTDPGQFAIGANSCSPAVLGPTGECTIDVTFDPTIEAASSAMVSIAHNAAGSPSTVGLTGTGIPGVVPVPPLAPTIGTATAGITSATVTWTAPLPNGGPAIDSYEIVATPTTGPAVTLTGVAATATSGTVTGLTAGTSYTLQVRAVNPDGSGPLSAASNAVTPTALVAPTTPTGVIAVGGNASASLSWTEGIVPVTSHVIQVRIAGGGPITLVTTGSASTADITGLVNGTRYTFKVRAVNAAGVSAFSAASNRITPAAPAPPATVPGAPVIGLATPGGGGGALTARVLWLPPLTDGGSAILNYQVTAIQVDALGVDTGFTVLGPLRGPGANSQTLTLPAGRYQFTVVAINAIGTSVASDRSNIVTAT